MRMIALEIPDESSKLPAWLEQRLVGLDLAELVAELEAVHGDDASYGPRSLKSLLGEHRDEFLKEGLKVLPREAIRTLLKRPRLLLDLQELALVEGGEHWQRLLEMSDELHAPVEESRRRIAAKLPSRKQPAPTASSHAASMSRRLWLAGGMAAAAASAVVGLALWQERRNEELAAASGAWGWNRPGALPQDGTPSAYLRTLADLAEEWFNKRPDDRPALLKRIGEFRQGCKVLLAANHPLLSPADRKWLLDKCRDWDARLAALQGRAESVKDVRLIHDEADNTIRHLIAALHEHAERA
jgi:hypothetical protein